MIAKIIEFLKNIFGLTIDMDKIAEVKDAIDAISITIGIFAGSLSVLLKWIYDSFLSPTFRPINEILLKIEKGQILRNREKKRVKNEARKAISEWMNELNILDDKKDEKKVLDIESNTICNLNLNNKPGDTYCSLYNNLKSKYILFFNIFELSNNKQIISEEEVINLLFKNEEEIGIFNRLQNKYPNSDKLFKYFKKKNSIIIWLYLPNIIIRNITDIDSIITMLKNQLNNWFHPNSYNIVMEVFVYPSLIEQIKNKFNYNIIINSKNSSKIKEINFKAAKYVDKRINYYTKYKDGTRIEEFNYERSFKIPAELLIKRITNSVKHINNWKIYSIFGLPGSGKTDFADLIINEIIKRNPSIFIICTAPQLLDILTNINLYDDQTLINKMISSVLFSKNKIDTMAFEDCLKEFFALEKRNFIIVIDDLDCYIKVEDALIKYFNENILPDNIKYILISRTKLNLDCDFFINTQCNCWNINEAKTILESWELIDKKQIEKILKIKWINEQEWISTYLLRIMAKNILQIKDPTKMIKNEINKILSSVENIVIKKSISYKEQLELIKRELLNSTSHNIILNKLKDFEVEEKIDLITVLGNLSWKSRFDPNEFDFINKETVIKWSSNYINNQIVLDFLNACEKANIFRGYNGVYRFKDNLIADGCAALIIKEILESYRKEEKAEITPSNLIDMINILGNKNSLEILKITINLSDILMILKTLIDTNSIHSNIVQKIITNDYIIRLKEQEGNWLDNLIDKLLRYCSILNDYQKVSIVSCLSQIYNYSIMLQKWCEQMLDKDENNQFISILIYANYYKNSNEYFKIESKINREKSYLLKAISYTWDYDGRWNYINKIISIINDNNKEDILAYWNLWCKKQSIESLIAIISELLSFKDKLSILFDLIQAIFMLLNKKKMKLLKENGLMDLMKYYLSREILQLINLNELDSAAIMIKWFAHFYSNKLLSEINNEYIINKDFKYAIPIKQFECKPITHIFALIGECENCFELPKSTLLKELKNIEVHNNELVSDSFPKSFSYKKPQFMFAANFKTWNGNELKIINKSELENNILLFWRPIFRIDFLKTFYT